MTATILARAQENLGQGGSRYRNARPIILMRLTGKHTKEE